MRERSVENYLTRLVEICGGLCLKFVSPGNAGVPDRIVIQNRQVWFVELKAPGKSEGSLQQYMQDQSRSAGGMCTTIDSREAAAEFVGSLMSG